MTTHLENRVSKESIRAKERHIPCDEVEIQSMTNGLSRQKPFITTAINYYNVMQKRRNMLYITSNVMFGVYELVGIFYSFQPLIFTLL